MKREEQIRNKARELGQTYFPDSSQGGLIMRKLLFIVMLCLCSCTEIAQDGIVTRILQGSDGGSSQYSFSVQVQKLKPTSELDGGKYYWFLTNDTLQIGDTIHIGKICKEH